MGIVTVYTGSRREDKRASKGLADAKNIRCPFNVDRVVASRVFDCSHDTCLRGTVDHSTGWEHVLADRDHFIGISDVDTMQVNADWQVADAARREVIEHSDMHASI
jgi:hypothetical protein